MPEALHDRAADNWRPLLAIVDLAGGDWPQKARAAAQSLSTQGSEQDDQSRGVVLLAGIRRVFDNRQKKGGKDWDRISSSALVDGLVDLPDRPWLTWTRGRPITTHAVAKLRRVSASSRTRSSCPKAGSRTAINGASSKMRLRAIYPTRRTPPF
jgi:hypothetical protein